MPKESLNLAVRLLAKFSHTEQALKYYEMLKERDLKLQTTSALNALLEVLLKQDRLEEASEIFEFHLESLEDSSQDLLIYSCMIKGCCRFGKID